MIQSLIDKQDNFEVIRDQIAGILMNETTSQQALAVAASEDPALWKLNVYLERANPWERWRDDQTDTSPIVSVWYDGSNFNGGNTVESQKCEAIFNIDCFGLGVSEDNGDGHKAGDMEAAKEVQRAVRLVRNILMASEYTYLGLQGVVWKRWPQSITVFKQMDENAIQVGAIRLALQVTFSEFSPQYEGQTLDMLTVELTQEGQVINASYIYAAPEAPTIDNAVGGDGSIEVFFTPAISGAQATSYTVWIAPNKGTVCTESPVTITGLQAETEYEITVTATNEIGESAESIAVLVTTN